MLAGRRFRVELTEVQERLARQTADAARVGWVRFRLSRPLDGAVIRSATLCREGRHWFVSLLVDDGLATPPEHALPGAAVGVDRGAAVAVATSAGDLLDQVFTTPGQQR